MSYACSIIVTGGTANLGYYTALNIARKHPDYLIVISSRTDPDKSAAKINQTLGQNNTIFIPLDLSDLSKIREYANEWTTGNRPAIQALILNAGSQFPGPVRYNGDGIELTFAVNHVGHALLFHLLCPYLAPNARITVTASGTHDPAMKSGLPDAIYNTAEELAHPTAESAKFDGRQRYATSKLTNILWTYALDRKLSERVPEKHITVNAFDPGLMLGTGLAREAGRVMQFLWYKVFPRISWLLKKVYTENIHTAEESGKALARLACDEDVDRVSGKYFEGMKEIKSSKDSYVVEKQNDLWNWTVGYVAKGNGSEVQRFQELN